MGPPGKCHLNGISLVGRKWPARDRLAGYRLCNITLKQCIHQEFGQVVHLQKTKRALRPWDAHLRMNVYMFRGRV